MLYRVSVTATFSVQFSAITTNEHSGVLLWTCTFLYSVAFGNFGCIFKDGTDRAFVGTSEPYAADGNSVVPWL